jgi:hypothetical protein
MQTPILARYYATGWTAAHADDGLAVRIQTPTGCVVLTGPLAPALELWRAATDSHGHAWPCRVVRGSELDWLAQAWLAIPPAQRPTRKDFARAQLVSASGLANALYRAPHHGH